MLIDLGYERAVGHTPVPKSASAETGYNEPAIKKPTAGEVQTARIE